MNNYKFNTSNTFCFECPAWRDRNNNGFGTCSNAHSVFNGTQVPAMNSCAAGNPDKEDCK